MKVVKEIDDYLKAFGFSRAERRGFFKSIRKEAKLETRKCKSC